MYGKGQQRGTYPDLFRSTGSSNLEGRRYTCVILLDLHVPKSADTYSCRSEEIRNFLLKQNVPTNIKVSNPLPVHLDVGILDVQYNLYWDCILWCYFLLSQQRKARVGVQSESETWKLSETSKQTW